MSLSLSSISHQMMQESPVFIVGVPRTGTTILYRTIQLHSNFRLENSTRPSGVELSETGIFKNPYNTYANNSSYANSDSEPFSYMMKNSAIQQEFFQVTQSIQNHQRLFVGKEFIQKLIPKISLLSGETRALLWSLMKNDMLVRSFFYYAKKARRTKRLVEKTPKHIVYLPEIRQTFPSAKIIFVSRHPVDVFSSYRMRLKISIDKNIDPRDIGWLKISPQAFCTQYAAQSNIALKEAALNPESFLIVSYEDFTTNLKDTLKQIFDFLGEAFEDSCIPKDENAQVKEKLDVHVWGNVTKKTKNWEDFITKDDASYIESNLSEIMKTLKYVPYLS